MHLSIAVAAVLMAFQARSQPDDASRRYLADAQSHFARQDLAKAEAAALKALERSPDLADAETLLGLIASARGQFDIAERRFTRAASLQPRNPRVHGYLGSTYLQQRRLDAARAAFEKVLQLDPENTAALYNLGLVALLENRPTEALPRFERVLKAHGADVPALLGALESALMLKRDLEALSFAKRLETALGESDPKLLDVAALLAAHGQFAAAIPMLERLRRAAPANRAILFNLALALHRSGRHDEAAAALDSLLKPTPDAEACNLLGSIEEARARPAAAVEQFSTAAGLDPRNEDYRLDHASALLQYESADASIPEFEAGVRDFPRSWRMRLGLGAAAYLAGDYDRSARALLEAVRIERDANLAYYLLGKAYESAPSHQPAIEAAFRAYLSREPRDAWAHYHYAVILYGRSRRHAIPDVESHLNRALALDSGLAEAHQQLGIVMLDRGRTEEAVGHLEHAVRADPKLATAHYRLALAYRKLGFADKAKAELDLFAKLKAKGEQAGDRDRIVRSLAADR